MRVIARGWHAWNHWWLTNAPTYWATYAHVAMPLIVVALSITHALVTNGRLSWWLAQLPFDRLFVMLMLSCASITALWLVMVARRPRECQSLVLRFGRVTLMLLLALVFNVIPWLVCFQLQQRVVADTNKQHVLMAWFKIATTYATSTDDVLLGHIRVNWPALLTAVPSLGDANSPASLGDARAAHDQIPLKLGVTGTVVFELFNDPSASDWECLSGASGLEWTSDIAWAHGCAFRDPWFAMRRPAIAFGLAILAGICATEFSTSLGGSSSCLFAGVAVSTGTILAVLYEAGIDGLTLMFVYPQILSSTLGTVPLTSCLLIIESALCFYVIGAGLMGRHTVMTARLGATCLLLLPVAALAVLSMLRTDVLPADTGRLSFTDLVTLPSCLLVVGLVTVACIDYMMARSSDAALNVSSDMLLMRIPHSALARWNRFIAACWPAAWETGMHIVAPVVIALSIGGAVVNGLIGWFTWPETLLAMSSGRFVVLCVCVIMLWQVYAARTMPLAECDGSRVIRRATALVIGAALIVGVPLLWHSSRLAAIRVAMPRHRVLRDVVFLDVSVIADTHSTNCKSFHRAWQTIPSTLSTEDEAFGTITNPSNWPLVTEAFPELSDMEGGEFAWGTRPKRESVQRLYDVVVGTHLVVTEDKDGYLRCKGTLDWGPQNDMLAAYGERSTGFRAFRNLDALRHVHGIAPSYFGRGGFTGHEVLMSRAHCSFAVSWIVWAILCGQLSIVGIRSIGWALAISVFLLWLWGNACLMLVIPVLIVDSISTDARVRSVEIGMGVAVICTLPALWWTRYPFHVADGYPIVWGLVFCVLQVILAHNATKPVDV
jgi:hypothetical protein